MCVRSCYQCYASVLIIFLIYLKLVHSWRPYDTEINSFHYEICDHKAVKFWNICLKSNKHRKILNGSMVFSKDMSDLVVEMIIKVKRSHAEDVTLLDTRLDVCQVLQQKNVNMVRITLLQFRKTRGYFPSKCPLEGNRHIVVDNFFIDPDMFPPLFPEINFLSQFNLLRNEKYIYKTLLNGTVYMKRKNKGVSGVVANQKIG